MEGFTKQQVKKLAKEKNISLMAALMLLSKPIFDKQKSKLNR